MRAILSSWKVVGQLFGAIGSNLYNCEWLELAISNWNMSETIERGAVAVGQVLKRTGSKLDVVVKILMTFTCWF